ncbi:peptidoglycan-binding domain-containing protein [Methylocella sp.]|jgi:murein L,D-transpeptidase YcbB/YkuD|uniref:peptidoglycan-binding domain-containing protein n=1 Tax=Methylocella sp. TaxID=1978226 RepID=UPI003C13A465
MTAFFAGLIGAFIATTISIAAPTTPQGYREAEQVFLTNYSVEQRLDLQIMLTAAGYWIAVPNENFSQRLFESIKRFQSENGFATDGVINEVEFKTIRNNRRSHF